MSFMRESLMDWLTSQPGRARECAQVVGWAAFAFTVMAVFARFAVAAVGVVTSMAKVDVEPTLATLYPGLPTWFVPETWPSYLLVGVLWVVYFGLRDLAKTLRAHGYA